MGNPASVAAIHYASNRPIVIEVEEGLIRAIHPHLGNVRDNDILPIVAPGLVDLQINGYMGRDFNSLPIGEGLVAEVIRLLWRQGVTSCSPTVITNGAAAIHDAMKAIARACDCDTAASRGIARIHLEGPFISPEDGARGAHSREYVCPPDWDAFRRWQDAAGGRIRIVTISPEWPASAEFIAKCIATGVLVSIGHTSATSEQIRDAVRAGARMSTHLGNGAQLMLPRHPNYIWEQLAQDELWSCLIADGFHLPDQVLKVVMKVKGERALLVSDAVSLSGMPPGTYRTHVGGQVVLTPSGKLHLAENERLLAGSAQMLLKGIENLTSRGLADFAQAWDMASTRPARLMGLPVEGGLSPGSPADFVVLRRHDRGIKLECTYKDGQRVFQEGACET